MDVRKDGEYKNLLNEFDKQYVKFKYLATSGNATKAAKSAGVNRHTFSKYLILAGYITKDGKKTDLFMDHLKTYRRVKQESQLTDEIKFNMYLDDLDPKY